MKCILLSNFFLIEDGKFITLREKLANGKEVNLSPRLPDTHSTQHLGTDGVVMNYAHLVFEMGLLFKDLLDVCKTPDQNRLKRKKVETQYDGLQVQF